MKIRKVRGFKRIYRADCFIDDANTMFEKNIGERKRYIIWLFTFLERLDALGYGALTLQQFEYLQNTENPRLYAIRHPHSRINERYIYTYADGGEIILLTAFMEREARDYNAAIIRAKNIYSMLEVEDEKD